MIAKNVYATFGFLGTNFKGFFQKKICHNLDLNDLQPKASSANKIFCGTIYTPQKKDRNHSRIALKLIL